MTYEIKTRSELGVESSPEIQYFLFMKSFLNVNITKHGTNFEN